MLHYSVFEKCLESNQANKSSVAYRYQGIPAVYNTVLKKEEYGTEGCSQSPDQAGDLD